MMAIEQLQVGMEGRGRIHDSESFVETRKRGKWEEEEEEKRNGLWPRNSEWKKEEEALIRWSTLFPVQLCSLFCLTANHHNKAYVRIYRYKWCTDLLLAYPPRQRCFPQKRFCFSCPGCWSFAFRWPFRVGPISYCSVCRSSRTNQSPSAATWAVYLWIWTYDCCCCRFRWILRRLRFHCFLRCRPRCKDPRPKIRRRRASIRWRRRCRCRPSRITWSCFAAPTISVELWQLQRKNDRNALFNSSSDGSENKINTVET